MHSFQNPGEFISCAAYVFDSICFSSSFSLLFSAFNKRFSIMRAIEPFEKTKAKNKIQHKQE